MTRPGHADRAIEVVFVYELVALHNRRLPTISVLVRRFRHTPVCRGAVWAGLAWLTWHLLVDT